MNNLIAKTLLTHTFKSGIFFWGKCSDWTSPVFLVTSVVWKCQHSVWILPHCSLSFQWCWNVIYVLYFKVLYQSNVFVDPDFFFRFRIKLWGLEKWPLRTGLKPYSEELLNSFVCLQSQGTHLLSCMWRINDDISCF